MWNDFQDILLGGKRKMQSKVYIIPQYMAVHTHTYTHAPLHKSVGMYTYFCIQKNYSTEIQCKPQTWATYVTLNCSVATKKSKMKEAKCI